MTYGISEREFYSMTIAEIERAITAHKEMEKRKATFDYVLADLIGRSVARIYNSENKLPTLAEAYPTLFETQEDDEARQRAQGELTALKFIQFAETFNKKFEREAEQ
jgi:hypothetical protein